MTLVWEDPPPPKSRVRWLGEATDLRGRPRKWARIAERPTTVAAENMASGIRRADLAAFHPRGAFDARSQGPIVWAVYVGDGNLPPDTRKDR
jgi:hypothetical protein